MSTILDDNATPRFTRPTYKTNSRLTYCPTNWDTYPKKTSLNHLVLSVFQSPQTSARWRLSGKLYPFRSFLSCYQQVRHTKEFHFLLERKLCEFVLPFIQKTEKYCSWKRADWAMTKIHNDRVGHFAVECQSRKIANGLASLKAVEMNIDMSCAFLYTGENKRITSNHITDFMVKTDYRFAHTTTFCLNICTCVLVVGVLV